jgi:hypothetical protein
MGGGIDTIYKKCSQGGSDYDHPLSNLFIFNGFPYLGKSYLSDMEGNFMINSQTFLNAYKKYDKRAAKTVAKKVERLRKKIKREKEKL